MGCRRLRFVVVKKITGKPVFPALVTVLYLEDSDVEFRVTVSGKTENAPDLHQPYHIGFLDIVDDARPTTN
jgi:hypothetical protein